MSISAEILRLQQAKAALKVSIEAKGVTVPASATLDDYAALVDQIQTVPILPYDAEIEYLQSTGSEYIDTNIVFADNFSWEVRFNGCANNTSIIGGRSSTERTSCLYYGDSTYKFTMPIAGLNGASTPFKLGDLSSGIRTVKATIASNKGNVWVDGVQQYTNTSFSGTYISGVSCALFASKFGNNDYREKASTKIYYFKAWQGNTLVGDFIPVRVGTTGYLYDRVSGNLFGNDGTGSFTCGPDVT